MSSDARPGDAPLTGVLLAGGMSLRMGRDKAMLDRDGRPLWRYVRAVMADAGCREVLVSGRPHDLRPDEPAVDDAAAGLGPLAGIAAALAARPAAGGHWLVVPVDLPLLTADTLRLLLTGGGGAPAACFHDHPLPALLQDTPALRTTLANLLRRPEARSRSLQGLLAAVGAVTLPLPAVAAATLANTNTPDEWTAAARHWHG